MKLTVIGTGYVGLVVSSDTPGRRVATYADIEDLKRDVGFEPKTELADGIARWVDWYRRHGAALN